MEPISSLAASVVAVLAPYLAEADKEYAREGGKAALNKIEALYHALKKCLKKKPVANESLADLVADPESQDTQASFCLQLTRLLKEDPDLTDLLHTMMAEINLDPGSQSFLTQAYGDAGEAINAGTIESVTMNNPPEAERSGDHDAG